MRQDHKKLTAAVKRSFGVATENILTLKHTSPYLHGLEKRNMKGF